MTRGDGFQADEGVIAGVSNMLRSGSDSLEKLGTSAPEAPDAGAVSSVMGLLMSKLVDTAGEISTGAAAAAAAVEQGGQTYVEADQEGARTLTRGN